MKESRLASIFPVAAATVTCAVFAAVFWCSVPPREQDPHKENVRRFFAARGFETLGRKSVAMDQARSYNECYDLKKKPDDAHLYRGCINFDWKGTTIVVRNEPQDLGPR
jgi:hypothetical protein